MPHEIADSDGESDAVSPQRPPVSPIRTQEYDAGQLDPSEPNPILDLQFSQFLSPTQRLSSAIQQQDEAPPRSSGSTDRFLRDVQGPQRGAADVNITTSVNSTIENTSGPSKVKRRFSDIEDSTSSPLYDQTGQRISSKKIKIYGNSRRTKDESLGPAVNNENLLGSLEERVAYQETDGNDQEINHIHNQARSLSGLNQNKTRSSTTRGATYSGYHGITLDFRNGGGGLDAGANPFGSLSQVSLDGEINPAEVKRFADLFTGQRHMTDTARSIDGAEDCGIDEQCRDQKRDLSQPPPGLGPQTEAEAGVLAEPFASPSPSSSQHETDLCVEMLENGLNMKAINSRRPTSKASGKQDHGLGARNSTDENHETHQSNTAGVEPETDPDKPENVDENDHQQETIEIPAKSKSKKRKPKPVRGEMPAKSSPAKNVSSELGLNDPNLVGMPKEVYHAKPSRSRSRKVLHDNTIDRPVTDTESVSQVDALYDNIPLAEIEDTKSTKGSRRKPKAKKGKTMAASTKEVPYGPEDSIDAEFDGQRELKPKLDEDQCSETGPVDAKCETVHQKEDLNLVEGDGVDNKDISPSEDHLPKTKQISIDIPPLSKSVDRSEIVAISKPKKRGRKAKNKHKSHKVVEDPTTAEDVRREEGEHGQEDETGESILESIPPNHPVLQQRDPNLPLPTPRDPSTSKTTLVEDEGTMRHGANETNEASEDEQVKSTDKSSKIDNQPLPKQSASSSTTTITTPSSSSTSQFNQKTRLGLSRRMRIPSLLRKLDRTKEPPRIHERKEKLTKKQQELEDKRKLEAQDAEGNDSGIGMWSERGADGMLVEWND